MCHSRWNLVSIALQRPDFSLLSPKLLLSRFQPCHAFSDVNIVAHCSVFPSLQASLSSITNPRKASTTAVRAGCTERPPPCYYLTPSAHTVSTPLQHHASSPRNYTSARHIALCEESSGGRHPGTFGRVASLMSR
jgi:hypothetical protein